MANEADDPLDGLPEPEVNSETSKRFRAEVEKHLRHLHAADPIRVLATHALEGKALPDDLWEDLYKVIWSNELRWHERYVAAWALSHVPVEGVLKDNAILAIFQTSYGASGYSKKQAWMFSLGSLGLLVPFILGTSVIRRSRALRIDEVALYSLGRLRAYKGLDTAVWALTRTTRETFPISSQFRETAVASFLQIAPEIDDSLYGYVDQKSLKRLGQLLSDEQPKVVSTALSLVEIIGDKSILSRVKACRPVGDIDEARIYQAIQRIEDRSLRANEAKTLVRPVVTTALADGILVRPATGVVQPMEQLLRPHEETHAQVNVPTLKESVLPAKQTSDRTPEEDEYIQKLVQAWLIDSQAADTSLRDIGHAVCNSMSISTTERSKLRRAISVSGHFSTWDICFACWLAGYVDWYENTDGTPLNDLRANAFSNTPYLKRYGIRFLLASGIASLMFPLLSLILSRTSAGLWSIGITAHLIINHGGIGSQSRTEISLASINSLGQLKDVQSIPHVLTKLVSSQADDRAREVCSHALIKLTEAAKADPTYTVPLKYRKAYLTSIPSVSGQAVVTTLLGTLSQFAPDEEALELAKKMAATGWTSSVRSAALEAVNALEVSLGRKSVPSIEDNSSA
jgi:hypothetical protein